MSSDVIHSTNKRGDEGPEEFPDCMVPMNTGAAGLQQAGPAPTMLANPQVSGCTWAIETQEATLHCSLF